MQPITRIGPSYMPPWSVLKNWYTLDVLVDLQLKAVQTMSTSTSEEDNDIANNILLNLFYDENNLDLIISNVKNYKSQSFG
jgi:hypothetical protein